MVRGCDDTGPLIPATATDLGDRLHIWHTGGQHEVDFEVDQGSA